MNTIRIIQHFSLFPKRTANWYWTAARSKCWIQKCLSSPIGIMLTQPHHLFSKILWWNLPAFLIPDFSAQWTANPQELKKRNKLSIICYSIIYWQMLCCGSIVLKNRYNTGSKASVKKSFWKNKSSLQKFIRSFILTKNAPCCIIRIYLSPVKNDIIPHK